jgi:hypothetical protein
MVGCLDQGIIKFQYLSPKVGMLPETFALPVMLNEIEPVKIPSSAKSEVYNGREFPVKSIKGEYLLIDQSRALLLFLLLFNEFLAQKAINPSISFTQNYLPSSLRVNVSV